MDDIERAYVLLGLSDEERARLNRLTQLANPTQGPHRRIVVETIVIEGGARTVVDREERSA